MSSGAVAASDPGGGEPKPVAGADVEMTEASAEVSVAAAADVKVESEGKAAAAAPADFAREGGDAVAETLSESLYATESAGMISVEECGDEPIHAAEGVNGGGGCEVRVGAEVAGLPSEAERKPVPPADLAALGVTGQAMETDSSVTSEHAEAESSKVEENYVNADPGGGNKERDNGVAHFHEETQTIVSGDAEGSSKIHEDDGAPMVDLLDDSSVTLVSTGEQVPGTGNNLSSNEAVSPGNVVQYARYRLPPLDTGGFQVSDLVWGKVKSHPWWPGEIFDSSVASELALKHQKKGNHLVAYFGDSTFAWCDESQLKPFVTNYSQMEKQSNSDAFVSSVNNALEELSRRILSGMSCSCLPEELSDSGMSYTVENAGLRDGVTCSAVNRSEILKRFSPENLLHYIKELSLFPGQGGDLLELVIACSQLTSFYRSKGCQELASFQTGSAWVEDGTDTLSAENEVAEEPVINEVHPVPDKPKRGRGRPRKQKPENDQEIIQKKDIYYGSNDPAYDDTSEKHMAMDFNDFDSLQNKKKRSLDFFEDLDKSSAPTGGSSFKIGECIRRAASQLTGSSSIVKAQNEPAVYKNATEPENGEFDISSDDAGDELTVEKRAKRRRMHRNHTADPQELLSQLCLVATEPMNGYSFSPMIISYFNDYRNYIVSATTEASIAEKGTVRRGRKRKVLAPTEVEVTDHMQDSYWSGLSLHHHPIHDLTKENSTTRPRRRRKASRQISDPSFEHGASGPKKQIQVIERSIIHVDEKMVDELKPTALVLSFARSAAVPSGTSLMKTFSRYGPLKEYETEVHKDTNTVKVVFKKRLDAERAFSACGKYGTFGPSLRSYRLVNMPFSLSTLEADKPRTHPEDSCLEVPGSGKPEAPLDAMQVDQVDTAEKAVVVEPAIQHFESGQQTSQVEAADNTLPNQVDTVDKTGHSDAELAGHAYQIGTTVQAESMSDESSGQAETAVQACTPKEASIGSLVDTTQSGAETGGTNEGMVNEIQRGQGPNQALMNVGTNTMPMEAASEAQTEDTVKQVLHNDATNKESAQVVSDNMEVDVEAKSPKQGYISGDDTVFGAEDIVQVDVQACASHEAPGEGMEILGLRSQTSNEIPVEQDGADQKVGSETPKQVSCEVQCSSKLEAETLTAEPVVQCAAEQVEVLVESKTAIEVSGEQACETVQPEAATEASGGQVEVRRQDSEEKSMAGTAAEHSVIVEETVESKIDVSVEGDGGIDAATVGHVEETAEGGTTVEAPDEEIENKTAAEALAVETREGEIIAEAPDDMTESKSVAEPIAGETNKGESKAEAPYERARSAEEAVEDVKALDEKITDKSIEDTQIATPVEKTITDNKATEDCIVETAGEKTTELDKSTASEQAIEDSTAHTPDEKTPVEAPDEKTTASIEDSTAPEYATVEARDENTTVEAPDEKTTASEQIIEDSTACENAAVEASDEKTTASENATVDAPDEKATASEQTIEDSTAETPVEKTAVEAPDEETTVEAPDEKTTPGVHEVASEQTG